jgi:translation elongation factor EF-1beta
MTKVMQIRKKNVDLAQLYQDVKETLRKENYKITKDDVTGFTFHMRAIKTNVTRIIVGAS